MKRSRVASGRATARWVAVGERAGGGKVPAIAEGRDGDRGTTRQWVRRAKKCLLAWW